MRYGAFKPEDRPAAITELPEAVLVGLSQNTPSVLTSGHVHPDDITGLVKTDPATQKRA